MFLSWYVGLGKFPCGDKRISSLLVREAFTHFLFLPFGKIDVNVRTFSVSSSRCFSGTDSQRSYESILASLLLIYISLQNHQPSIIAVDFDHLQELKLLFSLSLFQEINIALKGCNNYVDMFISLFCNSSLTDIKITYEEYCFYPFG